MTTICILLQVIPVDPNAGVKAVIFWTGFSICVGLFFYFLWRTDQIINKENALEHSKNGNSKPVAMMDDVDEETAAAIALAIHQYKNDLHDKESLRITLQKVSRIYSPWSSKIYSIRQAPRR